MVYRQVAERLNRTSMKEIIKMIAANEFEFMRLEHCIDRLDEKVARIIRAVYMEKMNWADVCRQYFISEKTLNNYRKRGIEAIADMSYIGEPAG